MDSEFQVSNKVLGTPPRQYQPFIPMFDSLLKGLEGVGKSARGLAIARLPPKCTHEDLIE